MKYCFRILFAGTLLLLSGKMNAQHFTNYTTANGLPDNGVNGVAIDGNNVKWFGTQGGVARFNDTAWTVYTTANGLIDNYINCIAIDKNNHVWAGTDVGVSCFDGVSWKSYTQSDGLISNSISYIAANGDGSIWIGTSDGVSKFNGSGFTNFNTSNGLPSNMVSYITTDAGNNVWLGTFLGGLCKYDGSGFKIFTTLNGLPDDNITAITVDKAGNKYIGTFFGIAILDQNDNYVKTFTSTDGMLNNYVKDLAVDSHSQLWAGIYADYLQEGGLGRYNLSWFNLTPADGLVNVIVKRIAVDKNDDIWVATGFGVSDYFPGNYGIQELPASMGFIYPNPVHDRLWIRYRNPGSTCIVFDATGKIQMNARLEDESTAVDVSSLAPGIYLLRILDQGNSYTSKFIVR